MLNCSLKKGSEGNLFNKRTSLDAEELGLFSLLDVSVSAMSSSKPLSSLPVELLRAQLLSATLQTVVKFPLNTSASPLCWKKGRMQGQYLYSWFWNAVLLTLNSLLQTLPPWSWPRMGRITPRWWVTAPSCTVTSLPRLQQMSDGKITGNWVFCHLKRVPAGFPKFENSASNYFCGVKNKNLQQNCI